MNLAITPIFTQQKNVQNNNKFNFNPFVRPAQSQNLPANSNLAPLARDTVSFGAKARDGKKIFIKARDILKTHGIEVDLDTFFASKRKVNTSECGLRADKLGGDFNNDIPFSISQQIFDETIIPFDYLTHITHKHFDKLVASAQHPERVLLEVQMNHKPPASIDAKLQRLTAREKAEIEEAGGMYTFGGIQEAKKKVNDPIRGRFVLRDSSKKAVKTVLQTFIKMLKEERGIKKINEIENYYPEISSLPDWVVKGYQKDLGIRLSQKELKDMTKPGAFSYPAISDLKEFEKVCREYNPELIIKYGVDRPNGYQALHVNGELADGTPFEFQFVGEDVCNFNAKREHPVYEAKCNKELKNPVMALLLSPLGNKNEVELQKAHTQYTRFVAIGERLKSPEYSRNKRTRERYLTAPKPILERGLGYNQMVMFERLGDNLLKAEAKSVETAKSATVKAKVAKTGKKASPKAADAASMPEAEG